MKWVTIISLVILLSFTESRILHKRDHHAGHHDDHDHDHDREELMVGSVYTLLGTTNFKYLAMVIFSQLLQLCPYEEQAERVKHVTEVGEVCSKGARRADCGHSVIIVAIDEICKTPENAEKYPFHAECCAKPEAEKYPCFVSHQKTEPGAVPAYQKPEPEQLCKDHDEHKDTYMMKYIYEAARRHPDVYPPAIISIGRNFDTITHECCKDVATAGQCFAEKMPAHKKEMKMVTVIQKHNCYVLKSFGERVLSAMKLVHTCQKYPAASFENIHEIVQSIAHLHKTCCGGDMMGCMIERLHLTKKTCEKKDLISPKLKECCDQDVIARSGCIIRMENDEKPADLSPHVREYIEGPDVCKHYADEKDLHLAKFSCDYAKRHPEFSLQLLLRISKGYQELLTKSCAEENPHDSLVKGEEELKKEIDTSAALLKTTCGAFEKLGLYFFQIELLRKYVAKLPYLKAESLLHITSGMAHIGEKCCKVPADKQMPCSEGSLSLVIGEMCEKLPADYPNEKVAHCCSHSYSEQRPCFTALGPDETYVPPKLSVDSFHFTDALCTSSSPEDLNHIKQMFFIQLMKLKPDTTEEQITKVSKEFLAMKEHCCKADNHAECFTIEGPKLIEKCEVLLGVTAEVKIHV
ncbi:serum albumin-like [Lissotriton helveticus]